MDVLAAVKPRRVLEGSSPHSWGRQLVSVQFFMGPSRKRKGPALLSRLEPAAAIQFCISQFAFVSCPLSVAKAERLRRATVTTASGLGSKASGASSGLDEGRTPDPCIREIDRGASIAAGQPIGSDGSIEGSFHLEW